MADKQENRDTHGGELKIFDEMKPIIFGLHSLDLQADELGKTPLHLAARKGNADLVKVLLESGWDINVTDAFDTTPLLASILYNQFEVVKLLLEANADIGVTNKNGKTALALALNGKRKVPIKVVRYFYDSMKRNGEDSEEIGRKFLTAGCSLVLAIRMDDAIMTRTILENRESIEYCESREIVRIAMRVSTLENVRVLLENGPEVIERKLAFNDELSFSIINVVPNVSFARRFIERLIDWNLIDDGFVKFLQQVFSAAPKEAVEVFIENNIDFYVKEKFGKDLVLYLCGNASDGIVELLQSKKVDVNSRNVYGRGVLHFAASNFAMENLKYLLDLGADPNTKDIYGITPLYDACVADSWKMIKCIEILLQSGADVQEVDIHGQTIFDVSSNPAALDYALAQLAITEAKGTLVKEQVRNALESRHNLISNYDSMCSNIDEMKAHKIFRSMSMFNVLTQKPGTIANCIRSQSLLSTSLSFCEEMDWHRYYKTTIRNNLSKALEIVNLRNAAAITVYNYVNHLVFFNSDGLILEKIVSFFSHKDLRALK